MCDLVQLLRLWHVSINLVACFDGVIDEDAFVQVGLQTFIPLPFVFSVLSRSICNKDKVKYEYVR